RRRGTSSARNTAADAPVPMGASRRYRPPRTRPTRSAPRVEATDRGYAGRNESPYIPSFARMARWGRSAMREEMVDELEEFVRRGKLWHADDLSALIARLEAEAELTDDP